MLIRSQSAAWKMDADAASGGRPRAQTSNHRVSTQKRRRSYTRMKLNAKLTNKSVDLSDVMWRFGDLLKAESGAAGTA